MNGIPRGVLIVVLSFLWFFLILGGYFVIRPVRETMGVASGSDSLNLLFLGTFVAMSLAIPVYSALVAKLPRTTVVNVVYRFFAINLLVFWYLLQYESLAPRLWVARAFFIWVSVYNLYAVSVFWSVMTDIIDAQHAKRTFGQIAAGGTLGAIVGSVTASELSTWVETHSLLLIPAATLEVGLWLARWLQRVAAQPQVMQRDGAMPARKQISEHEPRQLNDQPAPAQQESEQIGGSIWHGVRMVAVSPYLRSICGLLFLGQLCATYFYIQQIEIVGIHLEGEASRTQFFARVNLASQILTLILQSSTVLWLYRRLGLHVGLTAVPIAYVASFVALGLYPSLMAFAISDVVRRGLTYGVAVPAREVLFTVVSREDKYKSKGFIDTVIVRGGDSISSQLLQWAKKFLASNLSLQLLMIPVALGCTWIALRLATMQNQLAQTSVSESTRAS